MGMLFPYYLRIPEPAGLDDLHRAVTGALNSLIGEATKSAGVSRNDIYAITAVGNTCMHHLFVGINPQSVALAPMCRW